MAASDDDSNLSSSSEEDSASELDKGFLAAFAKIKQRDASIYDPDQRLFDEAGNSEGASDEEEDGSEKPANTLRGKHDPKFLRQVLAEQALEGAEESDSDDAGARPQTYTQEQRDVKNAFLQAAGEVDGQAEEDDSFGAVLKPTVHRGRGAAQPADQNDPVIKELLVKCFGPGASVAPEDAFLRDYVQRQQWRTGDVPASAYGAPAPPPEEPEAAADVDLDADLEHEQNAERFEASFNFRFEEPGAAQMVAHPREVEGIVRKKDERRKLARERKAQRRAEAERQEQEEAKRARKAARAARRAEKAGLAQGQVEQLQEAAGRAGPDQARLAALMDDGDWDPAAYDAAMASAFGQEYYDAADEFGGGDDGAGEDGAVTYGEAGGAAAERGQPGNGLLEGKEQEENSESKIDVPAPPSRNRFRYRQVSKADYGLRVEDILGLDSKELNQVVSLKRLAPYREERRAWADTAKLQELRDAAAQQPRRKQRQHTVEVRHLKQRPGRPGQQQVAADRRPKAMAAAATTDDASRQQTSSAAAISLERNQQAEQPAANGSAAEQRPAADAAVKVERERQRRLQSYSKLTLKQDATRDGAGKKGVKRKNETQQLATEEGQGEGLTPGERKRLKRSQKRAARRAALSA